MQMKAKHNIKWSYIPDDSYRILIIGGSGSVKSNALLNLKIKILNLKSMIM